MPFFNYFFQVEKKYNYQLSKSKPIVLRLDGKNITKSKNIDFSSPNKFSETLINVATEIINEFEKCISYVALDEVSFIFTDPNEFYQAFADKTDSLQYCLSIFQQYFLQKFWSKYPDVLFGVSVFNIPKDKTESYLKYRKSLCFNNAVVYFAKKHKNLFKYKDRKVKEIYEEIMESKFKDIISLYPVFLYGKEIRKSNDIKEEEINNSEKAENNAENNLEFDFL